MIGGSGHHMQKHPAHPAPLPLERRSGAGTAELRRAGRFRSGQVIGDPPRRRAEGRARGPMPTRSQSRSRIVPCATGGFGPPSPALAGALGRWATSLPALPPYPAAGKDRVRRLGPARRRFPRRPAPGPVTNVAMLVPLGGLEPPRRIPSTAFAAPETPRGLADQVEQRQRRRRIAAQHPAALRRRPGLHALLLRRGSHLMAGSSLLSSP